ncbi:T6SS effector amidase Tae4 family protein, partial [Chryseobacterium profundimaris]
KKPQTYIKIEEVSCNNGGGGGTGIIGGGSGNLSEPGTIDLLTPTIPVPNNFAYVKFISTLSPVLQQTINNENSQDFYWGLNNYFYAHVFSQQLKDFITWAIQFKSANPNVSWEQFQNWFMGESEGKDGEDYDATYWDDPNLIFPAQNLPSWQNYYNAFPKDSNGNGIPGPDIYNLVGGVPKGMRDGVLSDSNPNNDRDYDNACALRVSRALNYSGVIIPNLPNQTFKGADGKYYFLSAKKLNAWMRKTFGTNPATQNTPFNPKHIHITGAQAGVHGVNLPNLLGGKKGIYSLVSSNSNWASGHGDILLPNTTCINGCHFFDAPIAYIDVWILQ